MSIRNIARRFEIVWHWKYWPTALFHTPVMMYVLFVSSVRARKVFFFAAANPRVPLGGFSGDSKSEILKHVPDEHVPKSVYVARSQRSFEEVEQQVLLAGIRFPLIVKPDYGERGFLVKKLKSMDELRDYHFAHDMAYIIQEFIAAPLEFSVLVHNADGEFRISSFIQKEYMALHGNGRDTILQLLMQGDNTRFKKDAFTNLQHEFERVLPDGERYVPLNIGNLSYGTRFVDLNDSVDERMIRTFRDVNSRIGCFDYARYDIKSQSLEDLKDGRFYVMEINGVKGEPLHIYSHSFRGIGKGYGVVFQHWKYIYKISRRNMKQGAQCPGAVKGFRMIFRHLNSRRMALKPRPLN